MQHYLAARERCSDKEAMTLSIDASRIGKRKVLLVALGDSGGLATFGPPQVASSTGMLHRAPPPPLPRSYPNDMVLGIERRQSGPRRASKPQVFHVLQHKTQFSRFRCQPGESAGARHSFTKGFPPGPSKFRWTPFFVYQTFWRRKRRQSRVLVPDFRLLKVLFCLLNDPVFLLNVFGGVYFVYSKRPRAWVCHSPSVRMSMKPLLQIGNRAPASSFRARPPFVRQRVRSQGVRN